MCVRCSLPQGFVQVPHWAHLDIAGVMESHGESPMLGKGLTGTLLQGGCNYRGARIILLLTAACPLLGRPTRTLIQFLESRAKKVS